MNSMPIALLVVFKRLIIVFISLISCTSVIAETPRTHAVQDTPLDAQALAQLNPASGMHWQLLPGEDIMQIARVMFPSDATAREKFFRAVIYLNPELFPSGHYQPLAPGSTVQIPDLRTIHAFPLPASRKRQRAVSGKSGPDQPQHSSAATSDSNTHAHLLQLTTKLEQLSEHQAHELNSLLHHTETLASQVADMQSMQVAQIQESSIRDIVNPGLPEEIPPPPQQRTDQFPPDLTINTPTAEDLLSVDVLWVLGALLIVLILIVVLHSYRKVQQRLTQPSTPPISPGITQRHQYEALFLKQEPQKNDTEENLRFEATSCKTTEEARVMIKQGNSDGAVLFLQKQLSLNSFDISSWLLLFELLYSQKNKSDFKKNARRFKRLGIFPDIWLQIQDLGHRLEANEPLYFDEQKRQQRFFPESLNSELSSSFMK